MVTHKEDVAPREMATRAQAFTRRWAARASHGPTCGTV
jgi:hypothetical protein